tara:strand:+ start:150 stop:629 length:480 start_codon:yes stop_codon:yes gene_type:complete
MKIIYIALGLIVLIAISLNNDLTLIYPEHNSIIQNRNPTFRWTGHANEIIIDNNHNFNSPIIENVVGNSHKINNKLNFETYYWRLNGNTNSPTFQFSIDSFVALNSKNKNVTNVGNTDLDIEIHEKQKGFWKITGNVILLENETKQLETNSSLLIAKEK